MMIRSEFILGFGFMSLLVTCYMLRKRFLIFLGLATSILCIPLIAMQFTEDVNWELGDFIVAAILLYGTSFFIEFILSRSKKSHYRFMMVFGVVLALLVVWMELAVGLLN